MLTCKSKSIFSTSIVRLVLTCFVCTLPVADSFWTFLTVEHLILSPTWTKLYVNHMSSSFSAISVIYPDEFLFSSLPITFIVVIETSQQPLSDLERTNCAPNFCQSSVKGVSQLIFLPFILQ